jgi:hypothetical protein
MLPAQRRQLVQQFVRNGLSRAAQRLNGAPELDGVPKDNRRHDEVEPAGPVLLSFTGAVADAVKAMEANGAGKRVAGVALMQFRRGLAAQQRVF